MDIYAEVTNRIIAQLEKGCCPWTKPWIASSQAISRTTGKPYSLLNQMLLGKPGEYLTFAQCQKEGGKIKKGKKSTDGRFLEVDRNRRRRNPRKEGSSVPAVPCLRR